MQVGINKQASAMQTICQASLRVQTTLTPNQVNMIAPISSVLLRREISHLFYALLYFKDNIPSLASAYYA